MKKKSTITKQDIQKEWKEISTEAYNRAEKTKDQFNRDLVLIGLSFTSYLPYSCTQSLLWQE